MTDKKGLRKLIERILDKREVEVLKMRANKERVEVAKELGLSGQWIWQIEHRALKKMGKIKKLKGITIKLFGEVYL